MKDKKTKDKKSKVLLLVEDDMVTARCESKQLEKEGYSVVHAKKGENALKLFRTGKTVFDLVLMDIDLGEGMDGTEVAREILKDIDVPIVFLSNHTDPEIVAKTEKITSYGYVIKNTGITVLSASIKMAFRLFEAHMNIKKQKVALEDKSLELQETIEELQSANEEMEAVNEQLLDSEQRLTHSEAFLNSIIDQSPYPIWISDRSGTLIRINKACLEILNMTEEDVVGKYNIFKDNIVEEQGFMPLVRSVYEKGEFVDFDVEWDSAKLKQLELKKFSSVILNVNMFPIRSDNGDITNVVVQHIDITAQKKAEREIEWSDYKMRKHLENTPVAVIEWDTDFCITGWNPAAEKIFGYSASEVIGHGAEMIVPERARPQVNVTWNKLITEHGGDCTINENKTRDNRIIICEWYNTAIKSADGTVIGVASIAQDITEQKRAEQEIRSLLLEKEFILKDIHHRIKNNMNMITSLLNLQADTQENVETKTVLLDAASRVQSMMVLYDKLYRSKQDDVLNLRDYLPALVEEIISIYPKKELVSIVADIASVDLDSKRVSALGIIVNELITNAMKYAFRARERGVITLMVALTNGIITFIFKDDGRGLPDSINVNNSTGLGLQLIDILVKQIDGTLSISGKSGTAVRIEFRL